MSSLAAVTMAVIVSATGYVRSRTVRAEENDFTEHCLFWDEDRVVFHQSSDGYDANDGTSTPDAEYAATRRSFASWNTVAQSCGNFALEEGSRVSERKLGFDSTSSNNANVVLFRKQRCSAVVPAGDACLTDDPGVCGNEYDCWDSRGAYGSGTLAVTTVSYDVTTGRIFDADMEFNQAFFQFTTSDGPGICGGSVTSTCIAYDLENTMTHEVGHFLGLGHTDDMASTMYQSAEKGETSKRSIDADSAQFICDVYPVGYPSRDCGLPQVSSRLGEETVAGCGAAGVGPSLAALAGLLVLFRRKRGDRAP